MTTIDHDDALVSSLAAPDGLIASLFDVDPWILSQTWEQLLFCNWRYRPETIAPLLPEGLELDLFDGSAWVSAVPLHVTKTHLHGVPAVPYLEHFDELNLRTYVRCGDHHGVWFFSIDAANEVCSVIGRWVFHAPYHAADVRLIDGLAVGDAVAFSSDRDEGTATFQARYRPTAAITEPDDLMRFLTQRFSMFVCTHDKQLRRGDLEHEPWALAHAEAEILENTILTAAGLDPPADDNPVLLYSAGTETHAYAMVGA